MWRICSTPALPAQWHAVQVLLETGNPDTENVFIYEQPGRIPGMRLSQPALPRMHSVRSKSCTDISWRRKFTIHESFEVLKTQR